MDFTTEFIQRQSELRKRGWTFSSLAKALSVSKATISHYIHDRRKSEGMRLRICAVVQMAYWELWNE